MITDFREFERNHSDLDDFLDGNCSLVADTTEYLIYDLTTCLGSPGGAPPAPSNEQFSSLFRQSSHPG